MNIFILDYDIEKCAQYHCDKHVSKMILEHAQLICSVYHLTGISEVSPYKLTHKNHPCAIWARASLDNFAYLYNLTEALQDEYCYRYGKVHKSWLAIKDLPVPDLPSNGLTPFARAIADERIKSIPDAVEAYREYYRVHKRDIVTWKFRGEPDWWA